MKNTKQEETPNITVFDKVEPIYSKLQQIYPHLFELLLVDLDVLLLLIINIDTLFPLFSVAISSLIFFLNVNLDEKYSCLIGIINHAVTNNARLSEMKQNLQLMYEIK